ncbi:hypothetical protein [Mesorhizobium onobrychidis]|uniref:Phosphatase PAP2 family protein n=1 Tax=Mesorhizobium onobrychidis TaxID=2775404 RepID=A0ABY5QRN4_9HYPH|nr:hypothetical protein [Mesorhizobium onobrychidis]UVC12747.1 hypothetical protein IHQ72_18355 [Mesorhizobium onobrychidis]
MTAKQAADARMWAGVHFRSDVVAGQKIGEGVAEQVIAFAVPPPQRWATLAFDCRAAGALSVLNKAVPE